MLGFNKLLVTIFNVCIREEKVSAYTKDSKVMSKGLEKKFIEGLCIVLSTSHMYLYVCV